MSSASKRLKVKQHSVFVLQWAMEPAHTLSSKSSIARLPPSISASNYHGFELGVSVYYTRRRQWHPTPSLLPGKSHGWRSLVGCSPWGCWGLDTTERLPFYFSLSCIREGNGNPLQCSCLENPRDGGAWWAAVYGVAQSRTRLKRLSSSSSSLLTWEGMFLFVCWGGVFGVL